MTDIITPLMHLQEELQRIIQKAESTSTSPSKPQGHLRISKRPGGYDYYLYDSTSEDKITSRYGKYIRKDNMELVRSLAQKDYDESILHAARNQLNRIRDFLKEYSEDELEQIFLKLHPERKGLVKPHVLPGSFYAQRWQEKDYTPKDFLTTDTSEFYTEKGERVRSKSEIMLANQFKSRDIPYRYECPLHGVGNYIIYPDFTVLNKRTQKVFLWEHLGMMDDEKYASDAVNRIHDFIRSGYIPGKNLILTYETRTRPLSSKIIDVLIHEFLL